MKLDIAILVLVVLLVTSLGGCAGIAKDWTSCMAENMGSDWIVVQYGYNGDPINVWQLEGVSISNESASDGIFWQEPSGHLIHISGWYNRVQVNGRRFDEAAELLGIDSKKITNGRYIATEEGQ